MLGEFSSNSLLSLSLSLSLSAFSGRTRLARSGDSRNARNCITGYRSAVKQIANHYGSVDEFS
jgi:hypothetical protein